MAIMSRYTDDSPVRCENCGWEGMVMECTHGYAPSGLHEDVEPEDRCPICGNSQLINIEEEPVTV